MNNPMPTLEEVAAEAGVSRSTASRAINGGSRVSPQAQAAVEQAIARLGYTPNRAARSLVTRRTESIGLIFPEPDVRVLSDPFFGSVIRGLNAALKDTDIQLVLIIAQPEDSLGRIERYLTNGHIDGAIVVSHHYKDQLEEIILKSRLPAVFVGRPSSTDGALHMVDVDNVAGGRVATEHLIARGRTKIAHISGPSDMAAGQDRRDGWLQAVQAAGLTPGPCHEADFTTSMGAQAMEQILSEDPDIDAVFAGSDLMALGALRVLEQNGKRVPEDVSVVGYDDLGVAETAVPPLTTVINPVAEMTRWATAELLFRLGYLSEAERFSGLATEGVETRPNAIILPTVLVERASS
ncbi:LacI family DNA-binding transcriptional regulator [Timonella senegalensis]|uniref:LacI family DNA-binding transcriptional regulator n=1 Tax=Timonella senegalensis TaxID=1465825 RepID=UPI0028ABED6A|nr:LacI family DNA-binding transcriptional regulator [Timonella senegalensis]